jgi:hypothetical protein
VVAENLGRVNSGKFDFRLHDNISVNCYWKKYDLIPRGSSVLHSFNAPKNRNMTTVITPGIAMECKIYILSIQVLDFKT